MTEQGILVEACQQNGHNVSKGPVSPLSTDSGFSDSDTLLSTTISNSGEGKELAPRRDSDVLERDPHLFNVPIKQVWHETFIRDFQTFKKVGDVWTLSPECCLGASWLLYPKQGLFHFVDSAKVHFHCLPCQRGWTSRNGKVQFWYTAWRNSLPLVVEKGRFERSGTVAFRLLGQLCQACGQPTPAQWYPEEARKVVHNVYVQVAAQVYGLHVFPNPTLNYDKRKRANAQQLKTKKN